MASKLENNIINDFKKKLNESSTNCLEELLEYYKIRKPTSQVGYLIEKCLPYIQTLVNERRSWKKNGF